MLEIWFIWLRTKSMQNGVIWLVGWLGCMKSFWTTLYLIITPKHQFLSSPWPINVAFAMRRHQAWRNQSLPSTHLSLKCQRSHFSHIFLWKLLKNDQPFFFKFLPNFYTLLLTKIKFNSQESTEHKPEQVFTLLSLKIVDFEA